MIPILQKREAIVFGYLSEWDAVNQVTICPRSAQANLRHTKEFLFYAHIHQPQEITPHAIQQYLVYLIREQGLAPTTIHNTLAGISSFCSHLVERDLLPYNPCSRVKRPKIPRKLPKFLSDNEIEQTLAWAKWYGCWYEVFFCLHTGMRMGEMERADWQDVKFDMGLVLVPEAKSKRPRAIPLHSRLADELKLVAQPSGIIFKGKHGDHRAERTWNKLLNPLKARMPYFTGWPLLRKTFATQLLRRGVSVAKVSVWLGHADVKTTMNYYGNLMPDRYDEDIDKF